MLYVVPVSSASGQRVLGVSVLGTLAATATHLVLTAPASPATTAFDAASTWSASPLAQSISRRRRTYEGGIKSSEVEAANFFACSQPTAVSRTTVCAWAAHGRALASRTERSVESSVTCAPHSAQCTKKRIGLAMLESNTSFELPNTRSRDEIKSLPPSRSEIWRALTGS